ncbi:uncharacterized protein LOC118269350 [Spodoptera frugiperda]|uniref:Uncharacterized protein LOC118269350 n=1 Tax=Spodoptera frugiperda TaxID=7108 RepID=A0A9R0D4T4_SPOFR|nr:uncharacterized protein LOC118269350 [Spodoptera frugiperda]
MERIAILVVFAFVFICLQYTSAEETVLSEVLTPTTTTENDKLKRQSRSYYDYRYGAPRPLYDRLEYGRQDYDRPRCGRCDDRRDDRDDRDDDYDRRDRYDDDRRGHKPTYGNRYDSKKNYDSDEDRYSDRNKGQKNGTEEENGDNKSGYDDKDSRPSGSRRGGDRDRDRDRGRDRDRDRRRGGSGDRYDDRDRYRPDYYDRFLRDPYRERDYYDDYRGRRPSYDRYYPSYDDGLSRYDPYGYQGVRRPVYDDRGYDDGYGGYGPTAGRGAHDSFRPWDETYRGQAGWDAGGRGYYFASGRPDAAPASGWGRPEYSRPQEPYQSIGGYSGGYSGSYRDPYAQVSSGYSQGYGQGASYGQGAGYGQGGYGQNAAAYGASFAGYGQGGSGWHSVGERRPYRDESGVKKLENRDNYNQDSKRSQNSYEPSSRQPSNYGATANYGQTGYQQGYVQSSSTTPATSYLFQRDDEQVTVKTNETTKQPS